MLTSFAPLVAMALLATAAVTNGEDSTPVAPMPVAPVASTNPDCAMDPPKADCPVILYSLGDYGRTKDLGSCCFGEYTNLDVHAQRIVGDLMNIQAGKGCAPMGINGLGDNMYYIGVTSEATRDDQFETVFEVPYNGANIQNTPFFNVMGNHDYGGASFVCSAGNATAECKTTEELLQGLETKLRLMRDYKSHHSNWALEDHFYVRRFENAAMDVSVEVYNLDMNDATVAGAHGVCCQCYGYAKGDDKGCNSVQRGDKYCAGGKTDMYDACMSKFVEWSDDSRKQLVEHASKSNATWKIASSHYSPIQHFPKEGMDKWLQAIGDAGISLFQYGHTHALKADHYTKSNTYFIENGVGGGAKKEGATTIPDYAQSFVENVWTYDVSGYGFTSLEATKDSLKVQLHMHDDKWVLADKYEDVKIGGVATKFCLVIPKDGSAGKPC